MKPQATSTQQILQACRQIARAQGLGNISIRSAAAASGVAVGTIYHYFPSKEALLLAVTADVWSQIFGLADDEGGQEGQSAREVQPGQEGQPSCESHAESLPARSFVSYVQQMFEGARSRLQQYPGFLGAHAVNLGLYGGGNEGGHRRAGCMSG
ncbi:MAG: TetR/AcrR family transcriptional regulator, partial [Atopobiaceae bacterium]